MKKLVSLFSLVMCFVFVLKAQNVGIGTTTPAMALHVSKATDTTLLLLENRTTLNIGTNTGLYFKNGSYYTGAVKTIGTGTNVSRLSFFTFADGSPNGLKERLSITDGGNVGIGTTAPSAALHVNGTMRLEGNGAAAGAVLTSDASGNATWQAPAGGGATNVGFNAELASDVPLSNVSYNPTSFTENFEDGGNNFNASTGQFTAPSAGVYHFVANIGWGSTTGGNVNYYQTRILLNRGGSVYIISQTGQPYTAISGYGLNFSASVIYKLQAGDKVYLEVLHTGSATINLSSNGSSATTFSGAKLY